MEILRPFWHEKLQRAWSRVPIAWLSGVRRVGKTTLARSLDQALYLSCDLPSTAERVADPERFLRSVEAPVLILDEIHLFVRSEGRAVGARDVCYTSPR